MFAIIENPHLYLVGAPCLLIMASVIKIDKYETNNLKNLPSYSQLILSPDSYQKINLRHNDWFKFWIEGKENIARVLSVNTLKTGYEITLATNLPASHLAVISYKLERRSIWSEIFK